MAFQFYINDTLTDQPNNDMGLQSTVKRDNQLGAVLLTQDVKLEYTNNNGLPNGIASGYQLLKSLWDSGLCSEATIQIYDQISTSQTILHYTGTIKIADIELDEQRVSLSVELQDNSFFAYINNNKNVKAALVSDKTKSKYNIDPPVLYDINCFSSETGNYGDPVKMYRIYDVFKFLIPAITDNKVTFESDFLISTDIELFLTRGNCLIKPADEPDPVIEISFLELFNEVKKLPISTTVTEPIGFFIDATDPENPVLRIENESYFFGSTTVFQFSDIKELKTYAKTDKLYSTVKVGSTNTIYGASPDTYTFVESTQYFGWKEEDFTVFGQCNNDLELDLVNNYCISSNTINSAYYGAVTDFEGDLFIVQVEAVNPIAFTGDAKGYEFFGIAPPYYYNIGLNNAAKLQLYSNSLQNNIGNFLGIGSDGFRASMEIDRTYTTNPNQPSGSIFIPPAGAGTTIAQPVYTDDTTGSNFDGNGNYDTSTGEYILPSDGTFSFALENKFTIQGLQSGIFCRIAIGVNHYDSTKTTLKNSSNSVHNSSANGNFILTNALITDGIAGDVVESAISIRFYNPTGNYPSIPYYQAVTFQEISYFECNGTPEGGVTLAANTSDNYRIINHEFQYLIPPLDWQNIVANPIGLFPFEKGGVTRYGWIDEIKRNDQTGMCTIKLIASNATTP